MVFREQKASFFFFYRVFTLFAVEMQTGTGCDHLSLQDCKILSKRLEWLLELLGEMTGHKMLRLQLTQGRLFLSADFFIFT